MNNAFEEGVKLALFKGLKKKVQNAADEAAEKALKKALRKSAPYIAAGAVGAGALSGAAHAGTKRLLEKKDGK